MSEEQLKEAIQYNLDYLEGNIDFELEYKKLAESYSKLYEELEAKSKMLVNRDKELILFSDEIERLNNIINELEKELDKEYNTYITNNVIYGKTFKAGENVFREHIKYKLQELKGEDKE